MARFDSNVIGDGGVMPPTHSVPCTQLSQVTDTPLALRDAFSCRPASNLKDIVPNGMRNKVNYGGNDSVIVYI